MSQSVSSLKPHPVDPWNWQFSISKKDRLADFAIELYHCESLLQQWQGGQKGIEAKIITQHSALLVLGSFLVSPCPWQFPVFGKNQLRSTSLSQIFKIVQNNYFDLSHPSSHCYFANLICKYMYIDYTWSFAIFFLLINLWLSAEVYGPDCEHVVNNIFMKHVLIFWTSRLLHLATQTPTAQQSQTSPGCWFLAAPASVCSSSFG